MYRTCNGCKSFVECQGKDVACLNTGRSMYEAKVDPLDSTMVSVPLRLLLQVQWKWSEGHQECPVCGEYYKYGHRSDCALALAMKPGCEKIGEPLRIQNAKGEVSWR